MATRDVSVLGRDRDPVPARDDGFGWVESRPAARRRRALAHLPDIAALIDAGAPAPGAGAERSRADALSVERRC